MTKKKAVKKIVSGKGSFRKITSAAQETFNVRMAFLRRCPFVKVSGPQDGFGSEFREAVEKLWDLAEQGGHLTPDAMKTLLERLALFWSTRKEPVSLVDNKPYAVRLFHRGGNEFDVVMTFAGVGGTTFEETLRGTCAEAQHAVSPIEDVTVAVTDDAHMDVHVFLKNGEIYKVEKPLPKGVVDSEKVLGHLRTSKHYLREAIKGFPKKPRWERKYNR